MIKMDIITDAQTDTFHLKCTRQQQVSLKSADIIITFSSESLSFFFFLLFYLFIYFNNRSLTRIQIQLQEGTECTTHHSAEKAPDRGAN